MGGAARAARVRPMSEPELRPSRTGAMAGPSRAASESQPAPWPGPEPVPAPAGTRAAAGARGRAGAGGQSQPAPWPGPEPVPVVLPEPRQTPEPESQPGPAREPEPLTPAATAGLQPTVTALDRRPTGPGRNLDPPVQPLILQRAAERASLRPAGPAAGNASPEATGGGVRPSPPMLRCLRMLRCFRMLRWFRIPVRRSVPRRWPATPSLSAHARSDGPTKHGGDCRAGP